MKNVFKKTVALVSAMSLMAVGTAVSVSASAEKFEFEVVGGGDCVAVEAGATGAVEGYNTYVVKPGATIQAEIKIVDSADKQFDTICLRNSLGGLEFVKFSPRNKIAKPATDGSYVQYLESFAEPYVLEADETLITYELKVPADATDGQEFKVEWSPIGDYSFQLVDTTKGEDNMTNYSMVPAVFVVEAPVETTPAPVTTTEAVTTTEEITTTEAVTTTEEVTTTEAPVTTVVETTSATAGTTVSVSKAPSSPATGSSSNGVAALAVTMVAAAGAAIALKKKN